MDDFGIYEDLGVPIGAMIGDQQSATFGQACWEEGMVKNTYGTGCFLLMNTGKKPYMSQNQLLTTIAWKIGTETTYALEGAIFSAGASIQWLEEVGIVKDVKELTALAAQVEDNGGVYLVPAFAGLGSPYWDPTARGTILGLTRGSTKAHLARAALESIAFQSQEILELMSLESGIPIKELRVDGGASQNSLLMQWQADISQVKILQPKNHETTAYGAALLAGLAHGAYSNLSQIFKQWKSLQSFEPKKNSEWSKHQMNQWKKAVQRAMHWTN
jgi:glycerol kinase